MAQWGRKKDGEPALLQYCASGLRLLGASLKGESTRTKRRARPERPNERVTHGPLSAPVYSLLPARPCTPTAATLPRPSEECAKHVGPGRTFRRRLRGRERGCGWHRGNVHGTRRGGALAASRLFHGSVPLETKAPQRAVRGAGRHRWGVTDPPGIGFVAQRFQRCDGDSARGTASSELAP